jgi:hypothetical protein
MGTPPRAQALLLYCRTPSSTSSLPMSFSGAASLECFLSSGGLYEHPASNAVTTIT